MFDRDAPLPDSVQVVPDGEKHSVLAPFLKWPGGKRLLAPEITPFFSSLSGSYFEPFLGGAAVFFRLQHRPAFLADSNADLINCYTVVRDRPDELIDCLSGMKNSKDDYYAVRERVETDPVKTAARFIYLTSLSFNGIYRLNLSGRFNVPYGYRENRCHYDANHLRLVSRALSGVFLSATDFSVSVADASENDGIYFDPPYTVAHENNGFIKYNDKIFSWADQVRLRDLAATLVERGCRVAISNANHSSIRTLYRDFKMKLISRPSVIAASGSHRGLITECLFYNES